jgi:hypothetical protein
VGAQGVIEGPANGDANQIAADNAVGWIEVNPAWHREVRRQART